MLSLFFDLPFYLFFGSYFILYTFFVDFSNNNSIILSIPLHFEERFNKHITTSKQEEKCFEIVKNYTMYAAIHTRIFVQISEVCNIIRQHIYSGKNKQQFVSRLQNYHLIIYVFQLKRIFAFQTLLLLTFLQYQFRGVFGLQKEVL